MKLAVNKGTSRLAVYKCCVAADLVGIKINVVKMSSVSPLLPSRSPTLLEENKGIELFGEHAICRFLGSNKMEDSLEGSDWVEFDQQMSMRDSAAALAAFEDRFSSKLPEGQAYLASKKLGLADVCVGCTLSLAQADGAALGPRSSSWLQQLVSKHPQFTQVLQNSSSTYVDALDGALFSYMDCREEQQASLLKIMLEACDNVQTSAFPGVVGAPPAKVTEANKKKDAGSTPEFQLNSALSLFKSVSQVDPTVKSPKDVAARLDAAIKADAALFGDVLEKTDITGPGFINMYLSPKFLSTRVQRIIHDGGLKPPKTTPKTVGIDFSSPNIAKEMHVGHLRSTTIGEVVSRFFEFAGHDVKRINHIGDWGTQFGMLLVYMKQNHPDFATNPPSISDLNEFYKSAKKAFDASEDFKEKARLEVVKLQSGDEATLAGWRQFVEISLQMLEQVYVRLGVTFPDGACGESFYNSRIPALVEELKGKGLLEVDPEGSLLLRTKQSVPLFVVKRDGGYGYDTTDLAAVKYRVKELGLDKIIYITDAGQGNHFAGIFEASDKAGWSVDPQTGARLVELDHLGFGTVNGADGKKFKTRAGDTVRLVDLLDEARDRMKADLEARIADKDRPSPMDPADVPHAAAVLGYSGVKYCDLKTSCEKGYIFDYDAMLASEGDTAVYLIYSYARICSIERKVEAMTGVSADEICARAVDSLLFSRDNKYEWALAFAVVRFPEHFERAVEELRPHHLCAYIYGLASDFAKFYSACKLLIPAPDDKDKRILDPTNGEKWLVLIRAVKICLKDALQLLSIDVIERV